MFRQALIRKENTLFSMQLVVDGIIRDEGRHRDSISKMIPVIKELRKTLELERYILASDRRNVRWKGYKLQ